MNINKRERRLSQNLIALRIAYKLTARELDQLFSLSSGTWSRYENGEAPPMDTTMKIKTHFKVDMFDLLYKELKKDQL